MWKTLVAMIALGIAVVFVCSCNEPFSTDKENTGPIIEPWDLPFPGSEDQLMENFQTINEKMEFHEYVEIIHPDFQMLLQTSTIDQFPNIGQTIDRAEDLHIMQRMFSGNVVRNSDNELVPAISKISFEIMERRGAWESSLPNDVVPNTRWATFDVVFLFDRGLGNSTLKIQGRLDFFLTSRDSLHAGTVKQYFQMVGLKDLTHEQKDTDSSSFGTIKASYR